MSDQSSLNPNPAGSDGSPDAQGGIGSGEGQPNPDASQGGPDVLTQENARLQEELAKITRDMDRMRSTYDRQQRDAQRLAESRISDADRRVDEVLLSQLEGEDRLKYERDRAQQQANEIAKALEEERARNEEMLQLAQYRQYFTDLGLDQSQINYENMEAMGETAFPAIARYVADLKAKAEAAPVAPVDENQIPNLLKKGPEATPLMTSQGQTPSQGPRTVPALISALSKQLGYEVTENDIGKLIQRGVLDASILDSLDPDLMY